MIDQPNDAAARAAEKIVIWYHRDDTFVSGEADEIRQISSLIRLELSAQPAPSAELEKPRKEMSDYQFTILRALQVADIVVSKGVSGKDRLDAQDMIRAALARYRAALAQPSAADVARLVDNAEYMLNIFDRDLPDSSIGKQACNDLRAALATFQKEHERATETKA